MTGISHPSDIHHEIRPSVEAEILKWVNLVGLKGGAINVEFKLVDNQPILIEINLRLAGAKVNQQVKLTTGISPIEFVVDQACGIERRLWPLEEKTYVADAFIFVNTTDEIHAVELPDMKQDRPEQKTDFGTIIGHVLATGNSADEAMSNATRMVSQLKYKTLAVNATPDVDSDHTAELQESKSMRLTQ
jgi:biotin carboxylase